MMMVAIIIFAHQFETAGAIAKIKAFDHPHFFKEMHGTVNRGEVAGSPAFMHFGKNFTVGKRMGMLSEYLQDGRARTGDFA